MRLTRRKSLPDGMILLRGERVLAVSGEAVATDRALHFPSHGGTGGETQGGTGGETQGGTGGGFTRLPWERIEQAAWRDGMLLVREVGGARHTVRLTVAGSVPETVRERVTATVVLSTHVKLSGGGVRIAARRPAGGAGELRWSFVFDPGLDPADPGLLAQAEQALEDLRRQTGL